MSDVSEKHSTVPYKYRATLELSERLPDSKHQEHRMTVAGSVHPEPYDHPTAVALVQAKLARLVEHGWHVASITVTAYGAREA